MLFEYIFVRNQLLFLFLYAPLFVHSLVGASEDLFCKNELWAMSQNPKYDVKVSKKKEEPPSPWSSQQWIARINANYLYNSQFKDAWFLQMTQPIYMAPDYPSNTLFTQMQAMVQGAENTYIFGLGYRRLTKDENWIFGINGFYTFTGRLDLQRSSFGIDLLTPWPALYANVYFPIGGYHQVSENQRYRTLEKSIGGFDALLTLPIPNMPWFRLHLMYFYHPRQNAASINGVRAYLRAYVTRCLTLEGGTSQSNINHNNFLLVKLSFGLPYRIQFTMFGDRFTKKSFPKRDLKRFVLEPVRRINRIQRESKRESF